MKEYKYRGYEYPIIVDDIRTTIWQYSKIYGIRWRITQLNRVFYGRIENEKGYTV